MPPTTRPTARQRQETPGDPSPPASGPPSGGRETGAEHPATREPPRRSPSQRGADGGRRAARSEEREAKPTGPVASRRR
jgi:hypothetical protein